jgi:signal transduction histidine kinase
MHGVHQELVRLSEDVHTLAYRLHPSLLDRLGLANALKVECDRFSQQESTRINVKLEGVPRHLHQDIALCLFRVTQEALRNVGRHARAASVVVSVHPSDDGLLLTVADNGVGFRYDAGRQGPSLGLASMHERVRLLQGRMTLRSEPGRGTTVEVWVPLKEQTVEIGESS